MRTRPDHARKHHPEFEMPEDKRTLGEKWHEEVQKENPILAFCTFALGVLVILTLVVVLGSQQAYGDELVVTKTPTVAKVSKLDQAKAKASKSAAKSYSKWKKNMTKTQRKQYRDLVWKIDRAKTLKRVNQVKGVVDQYISRAKLCEYINAKNFSLKKAAYVTEWGKRVDKYLRGSKMAGTGYLNAKWAYDTGVDARLAPAIAKVESGKGAAPYGCKYNVWGWVWCPPTMYSWDDAIGKWHKYFKSYFKGEVYPIKSMHGYGGYGPWYVNQEMAKI